MCHCFKFLSKIKTLFFFIYMTFEAVIFYLKKIFKTFLIHTFFFTGG